MNINRKTEIAKQAIDSITTHDDVIFEAIELAAATLTAHIAKRVDEAKARRMAHAGVIVSGEAK